MSATITGIPELLAKFTNLSANGERMAKAIVQSTADKMVLTAKQLAPRDLGGIVQGISKEAINGGFGASIHASAPESAYMEFGTGAMVMVPPDMESAAEAFQGAGDGTFADFIIALTGWVKRHGGAYNATYSIKTQRRTGSKVANTDMDTQAAYLIARKILRDGLKPHPFLYPAFVEGRATLPVDLEKAYKALLNAK